MPIGAAAGYSSFRMASAAFAHLEFDDYVVTFQNIEINFDSSVVTRQGEPVHLTRSEFDMLRLLVENPGRALDRDEILDSVWGQTATSTRTVDAHMLRLRRKLEDNPDEPGFLITVNKVGYMFVPDAKRQEAA